MAGLYYGRYTMRTALVHKERESVKIFWQIIAFIGNTIAFLLIGFQANLLAFPQSLLLIVAAFIAVTLGRATVVYPILAVFKKKLGEKSSIIWSNISMLGGVRGAISIALAATIGVTAALTSEDVTLIHTLVFGVAFISIMFQVPILLHYAKRKLAKTDSARTTELNRNFGYIERAIAETKKLKAEGKLSAEQYEEKITEIRTELYDIICKSAASVPTKQIIQERASALFASLPKIPVNSRAKKIRKSDGKEESD